MRKRIKVDGKFYRPVKWFHDPSDADRVDVCTGCAFDKHGKCLSTEANGYFCEEGCEFDGHIFIPCTPEATVQYVLARLEQA